MYTDVQSVASDMYREALFFIYLLRDLEIGGGLKPVLCTNSQGCIQVCKDPAKDWNLKHIDTRYHFVRVHIEAHVAIE